MDDAVVRLAEPERDPYLSIVVCSRNDDYAGDMLSRLRVSLDVLFHQVEACGLDTEVIVVDWNPPEDRPSLASALQFETLPPQVCLRFISVPPDVHRRYVDWHQVALNVPAANNVGLRRARGRFVVLRASDVFYSEGLIALLARRVLQEGHVYRCTRVDVPSTLASGERPWQDLLGALAGSAEKRVHGALEPTAYPPMAPLFENASGDFLLAARSDWMRIGGLIERPTAVSMDHDGLALHALVASGCEETVLGPECTVFKLAHMAHTVDKVLVEPVPDEVHALESDLITMSARVHSRNSLGHPDTLGDVVRFRVRLLLGLPRRSLRNVGVIQHPPYTEFLYMASLMDRSAGKVPAPGGAVSLALRLYLGLHAVVVLLRHPRVLRAGGGLRLFARRVLRLLRARTRRPVYRMNPPDWGCSAERFEDRVTPGSHHPDGVTGAVSQPAAGTRGKR